MKVYDLKGENFSGNDVLVMASDGLWERFNSEEVGIETCFVKGGGAVLKSF